jgi:outer membrane protein assembly factor BamA
VELRVPPGEDVAAAVALLAVTKGAPLSVHGLRRTVQRLYQAGRYRNVIVRAEPVPPPPGAAGEWVRVVVEALPIRLLTGMSLRLEGGAGVDAEALKAAAGLAAGAPFDDSDLAAAEGRVRAALARKGFRGAKVDGRASGDREVAVELAVAPGEPVRVKEVRLRGDAGPRGAALLGALATRPGGLLDEDALAADAKQLRADLFAAGHRRARVLPAVVEVDGLSATVELPVEAGPRIAFAFRGNAEVPAAILERELGLEEGLPLDLPAVNAAADRLAASYRARGFAAARVEPSELRRGRDLVVVFHVDEGPRYRLAKVTVEGISARDPEWLRERLAAILDGEAAEPASLDADDGRDLLASVPDVAPPRTPPPILLPHEVVDATAWDRAAERLVDEWRADGWIEALYLGASVTLDASARIAETTLRFREGPRTFVESIAFEGNSAVRLPELARESRLAPGAPLAFERIEATREAILKVYLSRGHLFARVEAREQIDRERHLAVVHFVVDEGPQVRIGRLLVTGNRRTRDHVIRNNLSVGEGDVYDPDAVAKSQAALLRLGVFKSVGLRMQDPDVPQETKDLTVELAERPWGTLSQGLGFSIANGPRAFLEWEQPNLGGRALEFTARGKVNYPLDTFRPDLQGKTPQERIEGRTDLGLRSPGVAFLQLPTATRGELVGEILHRKAYDLRRGAGITGVDVGLSSRITASLQYDLEVDKIAKSTPGDFPLTTVDLANLRFPEGVTTLQAVRPSVTLDYRDSAVNPHRGWYATGSAEWEQSLGGPSERVIFGALPGSQIHTNMVKVAGTASTYLPFGVTVVALSLRGGRVFPLDSRSETIVPRRFFLGGATSMRGYPEEEMIPEDQRASMALEADACRGKNTTVPCGENGQRIVAGLRPISQGGQAFWLGKSELRFPLRGSLEAGLFAEVGNLWLDPKQMRLQDLRANVGVGLRFVTPIGPAALDLGFNVSQDRRLNEVLFAPHFTVGVF